MTGNATLSFGVIVLVAPTTPLTTVIRTSTSSSGTLADRRDTATAFLALVNANGTVAAPGQIYRARVCNQSSLPETLGANTGVSVAGSTAVAAGTCVNFAMVIGSSGTSVTIIGQ